jgi:TolB protein
LAFLVPELSAPVTPAPEISTRSQGQGALRLRWHIWNGVESYPLSAFYPTEVFLSTYLPFFDQYAQSHRFWSPDSQQLVYAGLSLAGTNGIWIQPIAPESRPTLVSEGVFATWSPQ